MTLARSCCQFSVLLVGIAAITGCGRKPLVAPDTGPPTVIVAKPIERDITESVEFTGRTDGIASDAIPGAARSASQATAS